MLKETLTQAMKDSMKAKQKFRLKVIRCALSEIKRVEIDKQIEIDDLGCLEVIDKMVKQRHYSAKQFKEGNRLDLVDNELAEIEILKDFLPRPLSAHEIDSLIEAAIQLCEVSSPSSIGQIMKILKPKIQGRANMQEVSTLVKERIN